MQDKANNLTFSEVFRFMEEGHKAKLPEWGGFWIWIEASGTILIFTKEGDYLDFRDSTIMNKTLKYMVDRNDWKVMNDKDEVTEECWVAYEKYLDSYRELNE